MLSVILLAYETASPIAEGLLRERVVRSLSSLVDGCVEGLFADAALVGPAELGLGHIADEAGCELIEAPCAQEGLAAALAAARCGDVFALRAGYGVERGFVEEARDALAGGRPAVLRAAPDSFLTRLAPSFAAPVGLIARKETFRGAGADFVPLARRLRGEDLNSRARRLR